MDDTGSNNKGKQRSKFKSKNKTVDCHYLQKKQHIGKNCPKQKGKERYDKSFDTASVAKDKSDFDADSALSVVANSVCSKDGWFLDSGCSYLVSRLVGMQMDIQFSDYLEVPTHKKLGLEPILVSDS